MVVEQSGEARFGGKRGAFPDQEPAKPGGAEQLNLDSKYTNSLYFALALACFFNKFLFLSKEHYLS